MYKFKEYFYFNKKERRGVLLLVIILFLILIFNILFPYFIESKKTNFDKFINEIETFEKSLDSLKNLSLLVLNDSIQKKQELFIFDPNNLSEERWKLLGLNDKQIQNIKNYEKKGGRFYKKEDLKKIYTISDEDYKILEPYIQVKQQKKKFNNKEKKKTEFSKPSKKEKKYKPDSSFTIELNSSDSIQLLKLKGIGPVFAGRIIKFRNLLGGFYFKDQLLEVYGIDSGRFDKFNSSIRVDTSLIKKININEASFKKILKHPYITFEMTKQIVNSRKFKKFSDFLEFKEKNILINDSIFQKIFPYLKLK
ncbi:MAG: helix-hairpin-helix domain-containing protein [Bacteroidales bacterium]|nr:helix-hairpin-helix domain-containing protein [Bacteroidales bacterium]